MQDLKVLALQAPLIGGDPQANRSAFEQRILPNANGHDLILLPETFTTGFPVDPRTFGEQPDGPTMKWMKTMAQKTGAVISGTLLLQNERGYSNTLVWMTPEGHASYYEKRHVFSMGGEDQSVQKGLHTLIVDLKGWKIKPLICYDLRFPVWSKNQYNNNGFGYDLLIYLANWPAVRSYPWNQLLIARAIENQCMVIGVNRVGHDHLGFDYQGDTRLIDPRGEIIAKANANEEVALSVTLSGKRLVEMRERFNVGPDWDQFTILP